jgi:hypothetical protein
MGATHFSGPVIAGDLQQGDVGGPNQGLVKLSQFLNIPFDATLVQSVTINIPAGSRVTSFDVDVLTAFNSATSATLSAGKTAGGTEYMSGVNVKAATGRIAPTHTAAQLAAMSGQSVLGAPAPIAAPAPIVLTVTSVGQPTAGYVAVTVSYVQQVQ